MHATSPDTHLDIGRLYAEHYTRKALVLVGMSKEFTNTSTLYPGEGLVSVIRVLIRESTYMFRNLVGLTCRIRLKTLVIDLPNCKNAKTNCKKVR